MIKTIGHNSYQELSKSLGQGVIEVLSGQQKPMLVAYEDMM
jgi:hypothetical protein